jgi:hypothetical protein
MTELSKTVLDILLPAIEAHKRRRFMSAPEITLYPDDRFFDWAEKVVYDNNEVMQNFIVNAKREDMDAVFSALTDNLWPAHRRAFASKLHQLATELDETGLSVSEGFALFYRERYDPAHKFHVELPVIPAGSPAHHSDSDTED